jgi:hypothetical protein
MKKAIVLSAILLSSACSNITEGPTHRDEMIFVVVDNCTLVYKEDVLYEKCESSLKIDNLER